MDNRKVVVAISIVALLLLLPVIQAKENGIFNRASGCNCHLQSGTNPASVSISGLPTSYDANKAYQITVSVSGGVNGNGGGFSLEVDHGSLSSGMSLSVNVQGKSATHSITGSSSRSWGLQWTSPSAGTGAVNIDVAGMTTNSDGSDNGDRWATNSFQILENVPANNPPSVSSLMLTPNDAATNDQLVLSYSFNDPDGDLESGSIITWYRDSVELPSGTINGKTVQSDKTQKGQQWYAEVQPSDGEDFGTVQVSNTVIIQNSEPELSTPETTPETPESTDSLSVTFTTSDADNDSLTTTIYWYLDGTRITEFDNDTSLPALATRNGDEWRVEVTVSDGDDIVTKSSQIITIGGAESPNNAPEIISYSINPSQPYTTDNLNLAYDAQDADGDVIVATEIEWRLDGELTSETGATINSMATQRGQLWQATIRASDGKNWSDDVIISVLILNSAPVVESLNITPATVFSNDNISFDYTFSDLDGDMKETPSIKWWKNGIEQTELAGENILPSSYTNKGEIWAVSLNAYDGEDFSETAFESSFTIQNSLPVITIDELPTNLTFVNSSELGLTINPSIQDVDGDNVNYQITWLRNGFQEATLDNATFVSRDYFGAGQTWTCQVIFDDGESQPQSKTWNIAVDNIAPLAEIKIDSINLWSGEIIVLNGSDSFDYDGIIVNYQWQLAQSNGEIVAIEGAFAEIIVAGQATVTLTVEDELGAISVANTILQTTQGPSVSSLEAGNDGFQVLLSWQWNGPDAQFNVLRNGLQVAQVSDNQYADTPVLSGLTEYSIKPVVDNQQLIEGSMTITDFQVEIITQPADGLSENGGFYLGFSFLLISIITVSLGLLKRRDNSE